MKIETDPDAFRVDVAEGKYSVLHDGKGKMTALRYGEPWGRSLVGDNLVFSLASELHEARQAIAAIRAKLEKIVVTEGEDAGVVLLSQDAPKQWDVELHASVYDLEYFTPLGEALMAAWKMTNPETL
jgi:hypothetical protein